MTSLDLLPLGAMLFAGCTMAGSNLAMRAVTRGGGRALAVQMTLFVGALAPLVVLYLLGRPALSPVAAGIGATAGATAFAAGVASLHAMRYGKVGPSMLLLMMGAAMPVLASALLRWDAGLTGMKAAGLGLALGAMLLCTLKPEAGASANRWAWAAWAFAAFLLNGLNQTCQKLLSVAHLQGESLAFNLGYFLAGLAAGGIAWRWLAGAAPAPAVRAREWGVGIGFGLLIAAQMYAILYAAAHLSAAVAFPTLAVLPLVLATLGAGVVFRERLSPAELGGIVLACGGLVLLNV